MRRILERGGLKILIGVDGGINIETAPLVVEAGASHLIAENSNFHGNVVENVDRLTKSIKGI